MTEYYHFLRPWWLLAFVPWFFIMWQLWQKKTGSQAWSAVCDSHLLAHLLKDTQATRRYPIVLLAISSLLMIISLAGPCWSRLPAPVWQTQEARVVLLDMSSSMMAGDVSPNRLSRALFKLQDLFKHRDAGQFALVVFTGEPFVVSPLTDDGNTISALLQTLTPDIMPVDGLHLDSALRQAATLITNAGFSSGQILVLTANRPDAEALRIAKELAFKKMNTSVMPVIADKTLMALYQPLATAGKGMLLPFSDTTDDINQWLSIGKQTRYVRSPYHEFPVWRDEGRWFLFPALLALLPVFRRGWLQRIMS